jgi:hypothetical protein
MSTEQNPHEDREPVESTVEIPTPTAAYPATPTAAYPAQAPTPGGPSPVSSAGAESPAESAPPSSGSSAASPPPSSESSAASASSAPTSAPAAIAADAAPRAEPLVRTGPRSSTVVWGVVVVAVALGLIARASGASVDVQLGAIVLLAVSG